MTWRKTAGQWQCYNADGTTIHWDQCSKRRWEQVKATGERFETKRQKGYANSVHGTKLEYDAALKVKGGRYELTGACQQCVPPWEVCEGCPDAFASNA